jgi:hypothetical protein
LFTSSKESALDAVWAKIKIYINGDVRTDQPHHFCSGCCASEQEAFDNYFAAMVEAALVLDTSVAKIPSKNRWGTCTMTMSSIALGLMIHRTLPQVVEREFPEWQSAAEPEVQGDSDLADIDALRAKIKKKTWRMAKTLSSKQRSQNMILVSWIAEPLDHLMQRCQYLSERRDALFHVVNENTSPFAEAARAFVKMLKYPVVEGPLRTPLWWIGPSVEVSVRCRSLILDMASQVWWRFLNYETWPYKLVKIVDIASLDGCRAVAEEFMSESQIASADGGRAVAEEFMSESQCCLDRDFSRMHIIKLLTKLRSPIPPTCGKHAYLHPIGGELNNSLMNNLASNPILLAPPPWRGFVSDAIQNARLFEACLRGEFLLKACLVLKPLSSDSVCVYRSVWWGQALRQGSAINVFVCGCTCRSDAVWRGEVIVFCLASGR